MQLRSLHSRSKSDLANATTHNISVAIALGIIQTDDADERQLKGSGSTDLARS
jgi:hypothetical protein